MVFPDVFVREQYNMYTYTSRCICNMKQTIAGFRIPISSASRICVFSTAQVFPPWNMTTWWSPSLVFQSLEVSNLEFLYCALAKVWPPKNGGWNSDIEGLLNFYKKTGLASMFFFLCFLWDLCRCVYVYPNDTVVVVKGGSIICCFRIFTVSFQALDLLWQAAHLQHTTLQATSRTRSGGWTVGEYGLPIWGWRRVSMARKSKTISMKGLVEFANVSFLKVWWDPIACGRDSWDQNLRFLYGNGGRFACTERTFYRRDFGDCRAGGYYEEWILALHPSGVVRCVRWKIPYSNFYQDKTWAEGI